MRTQFIESLDFDVIPLIGFKNRRRGYPIKFNPARIWEDLDKYRSRASALAAYMRRKWITVQFSRQSKPPAGPLMVVAGEFEPDYESRSGWVYDDIRVIIFASRDQFDAFEWTQESWNAFKALFLRTALHEIVHARQFANNKRDWMMYHVPHTRSKSVSVQNQRQYLSNICEVEAYAHCCYFELKSNYKNFDFKTLPDRLSANVKSPSLRYYLRVFGYRGAKDKLVIKRLVARIRAWERVYRRHFEILNRSS